MPRIDEASKQQRLDRVRLALQQHDGLTEAELAQMLQIERRTLNNYLHELEGQFKIFREGLRWYAFDYREARLRAFELRPE